MISSDSQAMGRIGEVTSRTWRTAAKMKEFRGPLAGEEFEGADNLRVKRYIAKITINPSVSLFPFPLGSVVVSTFLRVFSIPLVRSPMEWVT